MPTDPLVTLRKAADRRHRAETAYREALLAAIGAGHGYAEIAHELGVTRQTIRKAVQRAT